MPDSKSDVTLQKNLLVLRTEDDAELESTGAVGPCGGGSEGVLGGTGGSVGAEGRARV